MIMAKEDLIRIALEVTGMTRAKWDALSEEMKSDATMNQIMKREWNARPRDSEEAIREYYRNSDAWFINTFNHGYGALIQIADGVHPSRAPWCEKFIEAIGVPEGKILDYGGGFFKDSWPLTTVGYHVAVAEVRGPVTRFLRSFIAAAGIEKKFSVVEVDSATPIEDLYAGILCFETLEHLLDPESLTAHLYNHLRAGGPFAFSVTFGAPEHAPYHVASNAPLGDGKVWAAILGKIGFSPLWEDQSLKIWRSNS